MAERTMPTLWRIRLAIIIIVGAAAIALLGLTIADYLGQTPDDETAVQARTIANTDLNPYGANFFLEREVETWKRDLTLEMASEAGLGWVKQQFSWAEIEPTRQGEFLVPGTNTDSWAKYDAIVTACEAQGLQVVARLDSPPDWTREDNSISNAPPDNLEDYGDFVYAFVSHYKGRIHYIQIWNEPNIYPEWGNQPVDPEAYVEMLQIAYTRAKEADPNIQVLCAPLAFTLGEAHPEEGKWRSMNDLTYLEAMYEAGAADYFDIYSANVFGMGGSPDDPPDPGVLNFQRVLLHREIMVRYGDAEKAVWFNEYGWNAAPAGFTEDQLVWGRVSEAEQAAYTVQGIQMAREEWPWAGVFMVWYFRQVGQIPDTSAEYYFRMVDTDFTPRPLYLAVQEAATEQDIPTLGHYEETNPAVKFIGNWQPVLDEQANGGSAMISDEPGDSITFTFSGSRLDMIIQRPVAALRLYVVMDGAAAGGLDKDEQGRTYIDIPAGGLGASVQLTLVDGVDVRQHTITVTLADEGTTEGASVAVDALEVLTSENVTFPWLRALGLLAVLALAGYLGWRTWRRARYVLS